MCFFFAALDKTKFLLATPQHQKSILTSTLTFWHLTLTLNGVKRYRNLTSKHDLSPFDLDLWLTTLTYNPTLANQKSILTSTLTFWHLTLTLNGVKGYRNLTSKHDLSPFDLDLWLTTLTYDPTLANVKVDRHVKNQGHVSNSSIKHTWTGVKKITEKVNQFVIVEKLDKMSCLTINRHSSSSLCNFINVAPICKFSITLLPWSSMYLKRYMYRWPLFSSPLHNL